MEDISPGDQSGFENLDGVAEDVVEKVKGFQEQLIEGNIAYEIPDSMIVNQISRVAVSIAKKMYLLEN